ncbi:MAG: PTS sugar transporter subunit IIA, partial [Longimicrobiales bacterium]
MRLSDHLREDLVLHKLEASSRSQVLRAISDFLEKSGAVGSGEDVFRALSAREESHTTALGDGVADNILKRHPFPGPGLGIRILGEVKPE